MAETCSEREGQRNAKVELLHLRRYLRYTYRSAEVERNRMLQYNIVSSKGLWLAMRSPCC
jgi:hypothetical protein